MSGLASHRRLIALGAAGFGVLAVVGVTAALGFSRGGASPTIVVSSAGCAPGWSAPPAGRTIFVVKNTSSDTVFGVDLVGGDQGAVYGEIDMLAPGTTDSMDVTLPAGSYEFQCESFSGYTIDSRVRRVEGTSSGSGHPYLPVNSDQIQIATLDYRASLMPIVRRLARETAALTASVSTGRLGRARSLWLPAHLDYERLGAAYDTFGNFNDEIDERPLGLVGGVHSPDFRGFLRLEYGLWHGESKTELTPAADALSAAVRGLAHQFPQMLTPANDLSLRTHEILENTLQFQLTGEVDEGSHTELATAWANTQGTELALKALAPLLRRSEPSLLRSLSGGLTGLAAAFASYREADGTWMPLQRLSTAQREQLDSKTSALLEQLETVPDVLELPIRPSGSGD